MIDTRHREIPTSLQFKGWKFAAADCLYDRLGYHKQSTINSGLRCKVAWVLWQGLSQEDFNAVVFHLYDCHPDRGGKL